MTNTNNARANVSAISAHLRDYLEGGERMEGGRAALALDMVAYLRTPIVYKYSDKDGTEHTDSFVVSDLILNKPRNADGSESATIQSHRRTAFLCEVFGFEPFNIPGKMKSAIDKMIPEAIALQHYYGDDKGKLRVRMVKVPGDLDKSSRMVIGGVPASDMFELVGEGDKLTTAGRASLQAFGGAFYGIKRRQPKTDAELLEFMLSFDVETTGKGNAFFRDSKGNALKALTSVQFLEGLVKQARADKFLPTPESRNTKGKADSGIDLGGAVKLASECLSKVLGSDESDVEFSPELEAAFDAMAEQWAAYRARFPRGGFDF